MAKIKVLHLITHLGFGGASDNTLLTVERLPRHRYEVHLAAGGDYLDWVDRGKASADQFVLFPDLCRDPKPGADLRALYQLTRFMRKERYDIVHTHNAKAGILGRLAARWAATPNIVHTFHLLSWQDAMTTDTTATAQFSAKLKSQFYLALEKYAASFSDKIVTVCQENRQHAIAAQLAPIDKIMTIYSGIDALKFQPNQDRHTICADLDLDPDQPIIGMIGRLSPQKAPLDFVQAAKLVLQSCPNAQFIMVGDGPLLDEVSHSIGAESRIKLLGYRNDIPDILSILDIFALSSLWEGLGRALTEAMFVGIPVVATAVNGIPELVRHGETGLLSPPGAPAALAENMLTMITNPDAAAMMSKQAHKQVMLEFEVDQMIDKIAGLYEELLDTDDSQPNKAATMSRPADVANPLRESQPLRQVGR